MRVWVNVDNVYGTPVVAEACAAATSPWKSGEHKPTKPIGAKNIGDTRSLPNRLIDRSRFGGLTIIRGTMP
jgi:hypothetical protein